MKQGKIGLSILLALTLLLGSTSAEAKKPKVRLTGPPKERAQMVGKSFTIGVAASGFDEGWVEVQTPSETIHLPMERTKTNYLPFTPEEDGEHRITAVVTQTGEPQEWTSSIVVTVYPVAAERRAAWMVQTALDSVGSTDVGKFIEHTSLSIDDDWCAAFIGWCAKQVHIPYGAGLQAIFSAVDVYGGEEIACKQCRGNYKARFQADVLKPGTAPQPGDLVFFIWGSKVKAHQKMHPGYESSWHGNANHVGIITSVQGENFEFVHGNIRMRRNRFGVVLNSSTDEREGKTYADWVVAFARPHYGYVDKAP